MLIQEYLFGDEDYPEDSDYCKVDEAQEYLFDMGYTYSCTERKWIGSNGNTATTHREGRLIVVTQYLVSWEEDYWR